MQLFLLALALLLVVPAHAQLRSNASSSGPGSFQNNPAGTGSIEVLSGGFRRFKDSSGNTGILQRTPDSGFPNAQFIAPNPPALPPSAGPGAVQPSVSPVVPQTQPPQNIQLVPGTQIPFSAGQNR